MLERRAFGKKNRLLNAFNEDVTHWLDFFAYTNFMDRDGKFQLTMLSHSSFAPLAASMGPMLKEEAFHMGTGITGLRRIAKAGVIPVEIQQKYYNKWISGSLDLFGTDHSGSAQWAYAWGIKGRVDEDKTPDPVDKEHLNERARRSSTTRSRRPSTRVNEVNGGRDETLRSRHALQPQDRRLCRQRVTRSTAARFLKKSGKPTRRRAADRARRSQTRRVLQEPQLDRTERKPGMSRRPTTAQRKTAFRTRTPSVRRQARHQLLERRPRRRSSRWTIRRRTRTPTR